MHAIWQKNYNLIKTTVGEIIVPVWAGNIKCCYGLYYSTICCISQRKGHQPPHLEKHLTDFDETWTLELTPEDYFPCKIWFWFDDVGGLGEYPVCHFKVSLPFWNLFVTRTGHTSGPILTIYTSYNVFPRNDAPFGGVLTSFPIYDLGVNPQKNKKGISIFKRVIQTPNKRKTSPR